MEKHQISIVAHDRLGVLERVLRVIRHRGGYIHSMEMNTDKQGMINLDLNLSHKQAIRPLINQLVKLSDVIEINS